MIKAVQNSDSARVKQLLSAGVDPNVTDSAGYTPLMIASLKGDEEIAEILLKAGADVNAKNNVGSTPLMGAMGSAETVQLLIDHGADVNARNSDQWSVLEFALMKGCPEIIEILEKAGAKD